MKLTETIEMCEKLITEEIETIEYYIEGHLNPPKSKLEEDSPTILGWKKEVQTFKVHLKNLNHIKKDYETHRND
jgi:hypothetical protein